MKKFLLALPLGLTLALSACQNDFESPEDIRHENYTKAFIKEFGLIDPNQTWGFGPKAPASRADDWDINEAGLDGSKMNAQGNLWKNPPMVKDWEEQKVLEYLRNTPFELMEKSYTIDIPTSYFITHVYGKSNIDFTRVDGQTMNSIQMNELKVGYASASLDDIDNYAKWDHAKDFNSAKNKDNLGNTVCVGGGSMNFAYKNSFDSQWYDKYIIIPGWVIDYRLASYSYLCFDYEAYKDPNAANPQTKYKVKVNWTKGTDSDSREFEVYMDGFYEKDYQSNDVITYHPNRPTVQQFKNALDASQDFKNCGYESYTISESDITLVQYIGGDKVIPADGIYDDWVIRLCGGAVPRAFSDMIPVYPHEDPDCYRVFVEDLAFFANYNLQNNESDWDFNDLVFDVRFNSDETVTIVLRQLGGTLPIYFCDSENWATGHHSEELHSYFGCNSNQMINTGNGTLTKSIYTFTADDLKGFNFSDKNPGSIHIFVDKDGTMTEMYELKAEIGKAPSKLCVPSYLAAPTERMSITVPYPNFKKYVQGTEENFWEHKDNINNKSNNGN